VPPSSWRGCPELSGENAALRSKDVTDRFVAAGHEFTPGTAEALTQRTAAEAVKWAKFVKDAGIDPE
jgi:tripartite-type tricarboxylate transporter receptor subunit TctC